MAFAAPEVRRLLVDGGIRPSKALGQHFVVDDNTVRRIVRLAAVGPGDQVVEVGAGLGSLTVALARAGARVVAVETDHRLVPILRRVAEGLAVAVLEADALRMGWDEVAAAAATLGARGPRWSLVGNLPYNVATPLVIRTLEEMPQVASLLVMVQREVGERLAAGPGDDACGAVSLKVAYWGGAAVVGRVPPTVFFPHPRVESVLVRIVRHSHPAVDPALVSYRRLFEVVGAGFSQRRKMLRRSLRGVVSPDAFGAAGVPSDARAEQLDLSSWGRLAGWRDVG